MSTLLGIAHFNLHDGKGEEFTRLAAQCQAIVTEKDTGTLRYEVYLNHDQTLAVVVEEYVDEEALRQHAEHIGEELSAAILATGEVHGEILGELSAALWEQLSEGPVTGYAPLRFG